jgi:hypothetical protein
MGAWTPVSFFAGRRFETEAEALRCVPWLHAAPRIVGGWSTPL